MKRIFSALFVASIAIVAGCDGEADSLEGRGNKGGNGDPNAPGGPGDPGAIQCTQAPDGRSYSDFGGMKLEESRADENVGVNRARVKPFASLEKEFVRVLGAAPASLKGAAGSFDVPPARWFGDGQYGAVSLHAMSTIAYEGCLAYVKGKPNFAAAPTAETAKAECSALMRKAWSRSPSPEEITGCVDLAVKLGDEKDVSRRWAYACASVLSSSQFLTF